MIYTFYSYERKMGRSMALANVADLFYQKGLRVLVVDWDLESPGVEDFFPIAKERVKESHGLMDNLLDYKARMLTPIARQATRAGAEELAEAFQNLAETMGKFIEIEPAAPVTGEDDDSNKGADEPSLFERFRKLRERKTETPTVFISYAREDETQARAIHEKLSNAGFKTWLDKEALLGGQSWEMVIEKMIEESDFVLTCLSRRSISKRGYVQREIKKTLKVVELQPEGKVYLIQVRLDDCEIPRSVSKFNCVDLYEENGFEKLERSIRDAWRRSRNQRP